MMWLPKCGDLNVVGLVFYIVVVISVIITATWDLDSVVAVVRSGLLPNVI